MKEQKLFLNKCKQCKEKFYNLYPIDVCNKFECYLSARIEKAKLKYGGKK